MTIKFTLEADGRKLFEHIGNPADADARGNIDQLNPHLRAAFCETPRINYFLCQFTASFTNITAFSLSQLKGYRTGVQPHYFEKQIVIHQGGFSGHLNFDNANLQFEWFIISVQPQLSTEHRNTFSTYENEQVCHLIQKMEIENIKDNYSRINDKVSYLHDFNDRHSLYRKFRAYISNGASTVNVLDSSYNKEMQQATKFYKFFTKDAAEKIYIDMRETLG